MFGSHRQHPWEYPGGYYADHLRKSLVIRTALDPKSLIPAVRKAVAEVDKDQPAYDFMTMEQRLADSIALERFMMRLFGVFSGLALILAAVGIYGVMSFFVGQRTHEIGVRMALGALERDVLLSVVKQGLKLTAIGVVIGFLASLGLARLIAGALYGVTATDPATYLGVSLFMALVAFLASYIPARKAAKVDPMVALRSV
jgi:putative ABC transport system permease protein